MESYYYNHMSKQQQSVYHAMKSGLLALEPSFTAPRLEGRDLSDIFFKLRLDCPEIFWAVSFRFRYYPDSANVDILPEYLFDKGKVKEHQKAMEARTAKLIRQILEESNTGAGHSRTKHSGTEHPGAGNSGAKHPGRVNAEWEKEQKIHDFICSNVHYDKLKKPYSHEIIGPLGQGVGVCEGIAKSVKILCDRLGIWCIIAVSDANPEKKIKYRHAWNVVRIGGKYYHLDATYDNTLGHGETLRYDYFNLCDKAFFRDHEPVIYPVPVCEDGDRFYYREKKLSFTKPEDVEKRAAQAIRKGNPLIFHWRGGYLTREVLQELLKCLGSAAEAKERHARVSLNWPQAVLQVQFPEAAPVEDVVMEEANEEER